MGAPRRNRSWAAVAAVVVVVAVAVGLTVRHLSAARSAGAASARAASSVATGPESVLRVPHMAGAITLDGDTDDPGWVGSPGPARTGNFFAPDGSMGRPFSEIRTVWGDGYLYLALYAADEDIESRTDEADGPVWLDDAFRVVFSQPQLGIEYAIEVSPKAVITDSIRRDGGKWDYTWSSHAHASKEMDGTLNNPKDLDEEWAIEIAIPFEALGMKGDSGESIGMTASRCDTPKLSPRMCTSWGDGAANPRGRLLLQ